MSIATWLQRLLRRRASRDLEYVCRRCERVYRVSADAAHGTVMTGCSCGAAASLLPRHYFELHREARQREAQEEASDIAKRGTARVKLYFIISARDRYF